MSEPAPQNAFDPNNPDHIKALQQKLNQFNALAAPQAGQKKPAELAVSGVFDKATQDAWVRFKKEHYADDKLSAGYLLERFGIQTPADFNRDAPSTELISAVQQKLGLEVTGKMDSTTKAAVKKDKQDNYINGQINNGALDRLDAEIKSKDQAKGIPGAGWVIPAVGVAGAALMATAMFNKGSDRGGR